MRPSHVRGRGLPRRDGIVSLFAGRWNLEPAIPARARRDGSEANKVVEHFNMLTVPEQQEIGDFLRSL
jgi:hypothetical protein